MTKETTLLRHLIDALDDARRFHQRVGADDRVAHPYFRRALQRAAEIHLEIAEELSDRAAQRGCMATRDGTLFGPLRAQYAAWLARASLDIEGGYAVQTKKCEAHILQRFREAREHAGDGALRELLNNHRCKLEHAHREFCRVEFVLQAEAPRVFADDERIFARVPAPRGRGMDTVRNRGRLPE